MKMKKYNIFDIHVHLYPESIAEKACENLGNFYSFDVRGAGTFTDFTTQASEVDLKGFLTFPVALNPAKLENINNIAAENVRKAREMGLEAVGFMAMHQDFPDFAAEVDRCEKMGLCGIKIHPDCQRVDIDDPKLMKLYEIIEGRMPIVLHMGDDRPEYRYSEPIKLKRVLETFPNLEVIATHMGGYQAWNEAEDYLFGRPNVWYDASSFLWAVTPEEAVRLMRAGGTDRVMYGTDYPVMPLKEYFDLFMKCPLTEQEREDILYNNAKRLLKL